MEPGETWRGSEPFESGESWCASEPFEPGANWCASEPFEPIEPLDFSESVLATRGAGFVCIDSAKHHKTNTNNIKLLYGEPVSRLASYSIDAKYLVSRRVTFYVALKI